MDEEHMRVRRCADLAAKTDVDECTLYVERLPLHADHAWLKGVFSRYGRVVYVSLPRYRHNNRIKGFAFIEFAAPEDVDRACQVIAPYWPSRAVFFPPQLHEFMSGNPRLPPLGCL